MNIPHNFIPRRYQVPLFNSIAEGFRRVFAIWHRRGGKDKTLVNLVAKEAFRTKGTYYYFFPTYAQGKKVLWDGMDREGFRFMDHFPAQFVKKRNDQEMKLELFNGSIFQIVGTDKFDAVRGTNPRGCVFSEYAFQNPMAWEVVRPILAENGGWAVFNTTPNGKNHAYDMYEMAKENPEWFCEKLSVSDTQAISAEMIQEERVSGMSEEMIQQEYYVSFDIGMLGSIFGEQIQQAWKDGRVTDLPFFVDKPVDINFDLGISKGNETALWFSQMVGEFIHFPNYFEASGKTFDYFANYIDEYLEQKKGKLGYIYLPHDSKKRDWTTEATAVQAFQKRYGQEKVKVLEPGNPSDIGDFQKVRALFPKFKFDKENCRQGIRAIENYHYEYDSVKKVFRNIPLHDWASNGADSLRYRAVSIQEVRPVDKEKMAELEDQAKMSYFGSNARLTKKPLYIQSR